MSQVINTVSSHQPIESQYLYSTQRLQPTSAYVKLNVGGSLHYTTLTTLVKHDSMLRAMFSGRMETQRDADGWVIVDRCGKHFATILNFLRDGYVPLPESVFDVQEILSEAKYYCIQNLIDDCNVFLDRALRSSDVPHICRVPIIATQHEEKTLIASTTKPVVKLLLNRHNNKYSYTSQSDDNLLKNMELFDKLLLRFNERVLFMKDIGASNEVCSWTFYGQRRKVSEVCCTSIVYATDKKHTKVEFPEARIYEEAMNVLLYESSSSANATTHSACVCCAASTSIEQTSHGHVACCGTDSDPTAAIASGQVSPPSPSRLSPERLIEQPAQLESPDQMIERRNHQQIADRLDRARRGLRQLGLQ